MTDDTPPISPIPPPSSAYPEPSQATTILVLGILGLVVCGVLGPIAWYMGNQELAAIADGRRSPENLGNAKAGRILGMITTGLLALGIIAITFLVAIGVVGGMLGSGY